MFNRYVMRGGSVLVDMCVRRECMGGCVGRKEAIGEGLWEQEVNGRRWVAGGSLWGKFFGRRCLGENCVWLDFCNRSKSMAGGV